MYICIFHKTIEVSTEYIQVSIEKIIDHILCKVEINSWFLLSTSNKICKL